MFPTATSTPGEIGRAAATSPLLRESVTSRWEWYRELCVSDSPCSSLCSFSFFFRSRFFWLVSGLISLEFNVIISVIAGIILLVSKPLDDVSIIELGCLLYLSAVAETGELSNQELGGGTKSPHNICSWGSFLVISSLSNTEVSKLLLLIFEVVYSVVITVLLVIAAVLVKR